MKTPKGWAYAGVHAGIKAVRKDLALFVSDAPCVAVALLTQNTARAAPIVDLAARLPQTDIRALAINSGNANALTGKEGREDVGVVNAGIGAALGLPASSVISTSTGVIGVRMPAQKLVEAASRATLGHAIEAAAEAILTTDTRPKIAHRVVSVAGTEVTLAACGKGSGMVAPQLATMLAILTTDLAIDAVPLRALLARASDATFADLIIDGETSTNDAVIALANGRAGNGPLSAEDLRVVEGAVTAIFEELAAAIAEDGEGATKTIEVTVSGGPEARDLAHAVAGSLLVKTAVFGADPNWGRVLATIGARAASRGYAIDPTTATVRIQDVEVYRGGPSPFDPRALRARMREPRVTIAVDLGGEIVGRALGCDLSYDYVKINADYTALITASAEGVVSKDDRLANYTPGFKRALLVEALSYISRFAGKRAVVCLRGTSLAKDSLKATFAADINHLDAAGLHPIVVHEGSAEASTDLVSLLNQGQTRAVGISGNDGGMLRARKIEAHRGEVASVDATLIELLLGKDYIPVISPMGLGDDGEGYHLETHAAAAEIAIALRAEKLIFLAEAPGILEHGELISELSAHELAHKMELGVVSGGMLALATSGLRAIEGGVSRVHVVDGRVPHGVIAELFTDRGVGTLITP